MNNCYTFLKKSDALKQLEKLNNTEYKLFSGDTKNPDYPGGKIFFVTSCNYIYKSIFEDEENKYCYENYNDSQKVKLFFDIDYKFNTDTDVDIDDIDKYIEIVLGNALIDIEKMLNIINININNQTFIICDSNRPEKISFHIIFPNIIFDNVISIKNLIEHTFPNKNSFIDTSVYKTSSLRCLFCYKFGINSKFKLYDSHKNDIINKIISFSEIFK